MSKPCTLGLKMVASFLAERRDAGLVCDRRVQQCSHLSDHPRLVRGLVDLRTHAGVSGAAVERDYDVVALKKRPAEQKGGEL